VAAHEVRRADLIRQSQIGEVELPGSTPLVIQVAGGSLGAGGPGPETSPHPDQARRVRSVYQPRPSAHQPTKRRPVRWRCVATDGTTERQPFFVSVKARGVVMTGLWRQRTTRNDPVRIAMNLTHHTDIPGARWRYRQGRDDGWRDSRAIAQCTDCPTEYSSRLCREAKIASAPSAMSGSVSDTPSWAKHCIMRHQLRSVCSGPSPEKNVAPRPAS
jgi:hypothetical protein